MAACAVLDPPLPKLLDVVAIAVFLAATFGSDIGVVVFLVPTCSAPSPLPSESRAFSMPVLLGAYCPSDMGSETELPSLQTSLLFFSMGQFVRSTIWRL
jgi:hypothetical protein